MRIGQKLKKYLQTISEISQGAQARAEVSARSLLPWSLRNVLGLFRSLFAIILLISASVAVGKRDFTASKKGFSYTLNMLSRSNFLRFITSLLHTYVQNFRPIHCLLFKLCSIIEQVLENSDKKLCTTYNHGGRKILFFLPPWYNGHKWKVRKNEKLNFLPIIAL